MALVRWQGQEYDAVDLKRLTVGQAMEIESHMHADLDALSGVTAVTAIVWATLAQHGKQTRWAVLEGLTLDALNDCLVLTDVELAALDETDGDAEPDPTPAGTLPAG